MKKTLVKDTFREVKKSFGRFFSIFAIVAIGVAFFVGIKSSSLVMKHTADKYYDDYNLMDFRILSTLGLTEGDIAEIRKVNGVKGVFPTHSMDVLISIKSDEYVLKVHGLPKGVDKISDNDEDYINRVNLIEGRLPKKSGECVVEKGKIFSTSLKIGDKIKLSTGKDEDISNYLKTEEYTIVGTVETPYYLSYEKGTSDIGSGKVNGFIMIPEDDFNVEVYTEVFVTVDGAKEFNSYNDEYFEGTDKVKEKLKTLGKERGEVRVDDLKARALEKLNEGKSEYEKNKEIYENKIKEAEEQINAGKEKITIGEEELKKKEEELEKSKKYGQEELDKALEKIQIEEEKIDSIEPPTWYVLDRKLHYSYMDYGSAADRMDSIAKVFPVFFFIVAALVCLTTMTRMIDEERGEIGTLKALGYEKGAIASKFIIYAFIASISGSIVGILIGSVLFPTVIYNAWAIMYVMPKVDIIFDWKLALLATIIATLITTLSALFSCYKELVATPSVLMRPLPPKNGKRILLEKITFIWKRLSFTKKVTARNLFRYKKRFLMTVIGISGCTALLLVGYGIKDSIETIADIQYEEIIKFQGDISLKDNSTIEERKKILEDIKNKEVISDALDVEFKNTTVKDDESETSVSLVVPSDIEKYKDYVCLRERKSKNMLDLDKDKVIISEKLSKNLGVKQGDKINITIGDGYYDEVTVGGIMEMYAGHYVIMSPEYYKSAFNVTPDYNTIFVLTKNKDTSIEKELGKEIISIDKVKSVNFYSSKITNFNNTISSLNFVVVVLIVSAAALAFVVLYNLTNINISERIREIATIKVLGFYDNEVAAYVYRENIILTLIGSIVGLGLGVFLHKFIMTTVELENVMFGRNINFMSYIYSVLLTLGFGIAVNLVMYFRLKKIPMVESLKSVE